jgi:hypothetical protein
MYLSDENVEQWGRNRWEPKKALRWNQPEQRDRPRRNDLADYRVTKRCLVARLHKPADSTRLSRSLYFSQTRLIESNEIK